MRSWWRPAPAPGHRLILIGWMPGWTMHPWVGAFAQALRPIVEPVGLYCGGSLAMGDFRPGLRLDRFDVPGSLVQEIAARRWGETVPLTPAQRLRRAMVARRVMGRGIRALVRGRR